jgi:MOSC domain-containing protein YiiM
MTEPSQTTPGLSGTLFQISVSGGGVPKTGTPQVEIGREGPLNDRQIHTHVHGGPERAVCVYALELLQALQAEGHPIFPGALGENFTLSGIDWSAVTPGARLFVGSEVVLEVTKYTTPCSALKPFFVDQKINRVLQTEHPGWARVYTRVLQTGRVKVGDAVRLEPAPAAA